MCSKNYNLIVVFVSAVLISLPLFSHALTVGPVKIELSGDPGQTLSGEYFLLNERDTAKTFYPCFERYAEVGGDRKFFPDETDGISTWIETVANVTLQPNEQKRIPFKIHLPQDAPAGSHFGVTWWSTAPCKAISQQQVAIVTRAGILMLLNVSGDINESGRIDEFTVGKKLLFYFPQIFSVVFENTGNVYTKPIGKISVRNLLGMNSATFRVNWVELETYPKTKKGLRVTMGEEFIREAQAPPAGFWQGIKFEWQNFGIGPYKAVLDMDYGKDPKHLSQNLWFFVLPWRLSLIFGIILIIILLFFTKGIKAYNKWIVERAQNQNTKPQS